MFSRIAALVAVGLAFPAAAADASCAAQAPLAEPAATKPSDVRIGVALGSGAIHGLAHVGVLEELEAHGLDVKVVAGTSVGAVVGSLWASGIPAAQIESMSREGPWGSRMKPSWISMFNRGRDLDVLLAPHYRGRPIEAWPRRFGAVATNLANGHPYVFMTGDATVAVQASSSVPMLDSPVVIGKEKFGDGALVQPIPVDAARALGAEFVIAVDVAYRPYEEAPSGIGAYGFQAVHILVNALAERELRDADFALRLDLHDTMSRCGPESLAPKGREAMRNAWPQLERALAARARRQP